MRLSILNPRILDRASTKKLPQLVEFYARNDVKLSEEYVMLLSNWIRNLERRHYKKARPTESTEDRLDRVIDFVLFSKQMPDKDGALIMTRFSMVFSQREMMREMKKQRVAITDSSESLWKQYNNSKIRFLRNLASYRAKLELQGIPCTYENVKNVWALHRYSVTGKMPGKRAEAFFKEGYQQFENCSAAKSAVEKSWINIHEVN